LKIKITCPVPEKNLQAGLIYDLPDEQAQDLIDQEKAFEVDQSANLIDVTAAGSSVPTFIEGAKESVKARKTKKDGEQ
jgi:hypothetical protein